MKTDKYFNATYQLIIGLSMILFAIFNIFGRKWFYVNLVNIFLIFVLLRSIGLLISKRKRNNIIILFYIVFSVIMLLFKNIPLSILPILFGIYLFLNGVSKIINGFILRYEETDGYIREFSLSAFYIILSFPCIFVPLKYIDIFLVCLGIYMFLLGLNYVRDFFECILPSKYTNGFKERIRISLPTVFESIIPYIVLNEINNLILNDDNYDLNKNEKKEEEADISVLVHISKNGFNRLGHCDILYKNKLYTFGGYDENRRSFFEMIGDGVLAISEPNKYIKFCIEHSKKTLFVFGLKLTEKEKLQVEKRLETLKSYTYPWKTKYEEDLLVNPKVKGKDYNDYASRLYLDVGSELYKFNASKFKKFFVIGTNCCRLVDYILGKNGIDVIKLYGIITPGTYYEYFNREYYKANSKVISREIYNSKNFKNK